MFDFERNGAPNREIVITHTRKLLRGIGHAFSRPALDNAHRGELLAQSLRRLLEFGGIAKGDLEAEFILMEGEDANVQKASGPMVLKTPLKTPLKYSISNRYSTQSRVMNKDEKEEAMREFRRVLFSEDEVSPLEKEEAELIAKMQQEHLHRDFLEHSQ